MISDTLANAIIEIERYQKQYPECYGDEEIKTKIEAAKLVMESVRIYLDTPPINISSATDNIKPKQANDFKHPHPYSNLKSYSPDTNITIPKIANREPRKLIDYSSKANFTIPCVPDRDPRIDPRVSQE